MRFTRNEKNRAVALTGRASDSKSEGCGFESLLPCQIEEVVRGKKKIQMAIHRKEQGKIVRLSSFGLLLVMSLFVYFGLERFLNAYDLREPVYFSLAAYEVTLPRILSLVCAGVLLWFAWRWTHVKPRAVDFLVDVEGEMRKVVWPYNSEGRTFGEKTKELRTSSIVVVGVVIFLAYTLFLFDKGFSELMRIFLRTQG
jgi:preprotein translocase subunit SecE